MLLIGFVLLACFTISQQFPASLLQNGDDESRIYGGKLANQGDFPWMVNLVIENPDGTTTSNCGGFLISKTHVLTAAHCVCENATTKLYVNVTGIVGRIGHVNRVDATEVEFDKIYVHQDYDEDHNHDIAILKLKSPIKKFNKNIRSICIADEGKMYPNGTAVVQMGWGSFDNVTLDPTPTLKTTSLGQMLDRPTCKLEMRSSSKLRLGVGKLCVSNGSGEKICEGDSGGPLCIINGADKLAVGIVSFAYYEWCVAGSEFPSTYTDIGYYAAWIKKAIKDKDICWKN